METLSKTSLHSSHAQITDRAYERVDALLRAYGFSHAVLRSQHCLRILEQALQELPKEEEEDHLESLAARIALKKIRTGVRHFIITTGFTIEEVNPENFYLTLQATNIPQNYPGILLGDDNPDEALLEQVRRHYESQAKPTLRRISMGAPSLRFDAIDEVTDNTERFFQQHPKFSSLLRLTLIGATLYLVFTFAK